MAEYDVQNYADLINSRLNQLQTLQSTGSSLLGTVSIGALIGITNMAIRNQENSIHNFEVLKISSVIVFSIVLLWSYFFPTTKFLL